MEIWNLYGNSKQDEKLKWKFVIYMKTIKRKKNQNLKFV